MESDASQCIAVDSDVEPTAPMTVGTWGAGQIHPDFRFSERHPVNAALAQSSAQGRPRVGTARQILVGGYRDPLDARRDHVSSMPDGRNAMTPTNAERNYQLRQAITCEQLINDGDVFQICDTKADGHGVTEQLIPRSGVDGSREKLLPWERRDPEGAVAGSRLGQANLVHHCWSSLPSSQVSRIGSESLTGESLTVRHLSSSPTAWICQKSMLSASSVFR